MKATIIGSFLMAMATTLSAQVLISDSLLISFSQQELIDLGVGNAENAVEVHRLIYTTVDPFGAPTIASGAVVLPVGTSCYHALAAYMHGTILDREDVPSRLSGEMIVGYFMGGTGYVAALPDYLGLGDSPGPHPYVHAASEATASIDMMRATREFCAQQAVLLNGQVFLTGYSQGGHACMATHKMIQEQFGEEFNLTASAPCSGPYDVSGSQAQAMVTPDPYPAPYYLPYVLFSYGYVYPDLYADIGEVIQEPWATSLPPLFQGNNGSGAVDAIMPAAPSEILQDSVLQSFSTDPNHRMRVALRDNDLYDWAPIAPTRIIYCNGDDHVFAENSIVTINAMQLNGAINVVGVDMGDLDHSACAFPALLNAKSFFDGLKGDCSWNGIDEQTTVSWSLSPNPSNGLILLRSYNSNNVKVVWDLLQVDGRTVKKGNSRSSNGQLGFDFSDVIPGTYLLKIESGSDQRTLKLMLN